MKNILNYLLLFLILVVPITIKADFQFEIDSEIEKQEDVNGSSLLIGNEVISNNYIDGINIIIGDTTKHNGISEYLITLGNNIFINGNINKDGLIIGNYIELSNFTANRDLFILASSIESIDSKINRNINIYTQTINIENTTIEGDIKINASNITLGSNVIINGKLSYNEDAIVDISDSSTISNIELIKSSNTLTIKEKITNYMTSYASCLLIFVVIALLIPKQLEKFNNLKNLNFSNIFITFGYGILLLIFSPILLILLMNIPIVSSLAIILLLIYIILICLSKIIFSYFLGNIVWDKFIKKDKNILIIGLIGISIVSILELLPVLGIYITILATILGIGITIKMLKKD